MENKADLRASIIIVDDDEDLLNMIQNSLVFEGYRCVTSTRADTALKLVTEQPFDILLTDIRMPGMKGFELTRNAKRIRPEMNVIIMTGFIEEFSYDNAINAGASDFIKKPFTLTELFIRIQHVKMLERMRVKAVTDELTGLFNRRGFFAVAEQQLKIAKREKKSLYILSVDLDDFKEINDTLGHQDGDAALIDIANVFREVFREPDIIARIGGDEFIAIPIGASEAGSAVVIERLFRFLETQNKKSDRRYKLSISVGIAHFNPEYPSTLHQLLDAADKSMYEQKKRLKE